MSSASNPHDPISALRQMWSSLGVPLPGLITPTLDTDELEKNITDLKAVEGWLKANLSLLQMNIQTLELQRASILAFRAMGEAARSEQQAPAAAATPDAAATPADGTGEAPAAESPAGINAQVLASLFDPNTWGLDLTSLRAKQPEAPPAAEAGEPAASPKASGTRKRAAPRKPKA